MILNEVQEEGRMARITMVCQKLEDLIHMNRETSVVTRFPLLSICVCLAVQELLVAIRESPELKWNQEAI
jgi:hypothetical protein